MLFLVTSTTALASINAGTATTTDLDNIGVVNYIPEKLATYKANIATAKATKDSDLTVAEVKEVIAKTDLNVEALALKSAIEESTYITSAGDKTVTLNDTNITLALSGTESTVITAIDNTNKKITVADENATGNVTIKLTKNDTVLTITMNVTGNGSSSWTCSASYTPFSF